MKGSDCVLWLTLGGRSIASSRVRAYRLSDALEASGVDSRCVPAAGVPGRARAVVQLLLLRRAAVIVIQKILFGPVMLRLLRWRAGVLVWECDDALHIGFPGTRPSELATTRRRLEATLRIVDIVTTSNPLLADELQPASGRVVCYQGPAPASSSASADRERVLVWLGSPSTQSYLSLLGDVPGRLRAAGWECVAVGATAEVTELGWRSVGWSLDAQEAWLSRACVGVMPQTSDPWADRKQAYKLLEYMAHGVIPVASDVLPARIILDDRRLKSLLVAENGDWWSAVEAAAALREELLPCLDALVQRRLVECSMETWREAVGLGAAA